MDNNPNERKPFQTVVAMYVSRRRRLGQYTLDFGASCPNSATSVNVSVAFAIINQTLRATAALEALYCTVPFRKTVCGLLLALSLTTILAVSLVPLVAADGVSVTVKVQLPPEAKLFGLIGQLLVIVKSPA